MKNARQTVKNLIDNRHVSRIGKYDNMFSVFEKNQEDEMD